jgi:excisionase family DNA binding protein
VPDVISDNLFQVEMLTIEQFAAKMAVSRTTVYEWLKSGYLRAGRHFIKIGGTVRFAWGPELFQKLFEDSQTEEPKQEVQKDECKEVKFHQPPTSRKAASQINLDY